MVDKPTRLARAGVGLGTRLLRTLTTSTIQQQPARWLAHEVFNGYDPRGWVQRTMVQRDTFDVGTDADAGTVTLTGYGSVSADATRIRERTATLNGYGTIAATASRLRGAAATLTGFGSVTAAATTVAAPSTNTFQASAFQETGFQMDAFTAFEPGAFDFGGFQTYPTFQADAFQPDSFLVWATSKSAAATTLAGKIQANADFKVTKGATATLTGRGTIVATAGNVLSAAFTDAFQYDTFQAQSGTAVQDAFQASAFQNDSFQLNATAFTYSRAATAVGRIIAQANISPALIKTTSATLRGTSALTATADKPAFLAPPTTLTGYGSIAATAGVERNGAATVYGRGIVVAEAGRIRPASATLVGHGSISAQPGNVLSASATLSGTSSLTAGYTRIKSAGASIMLSGGGVVVAAVSNGTIFNSATLTGRGSVTATAGAIRGVSQSLTGRGSVVATAGAIRGASATLKGTGSVSTVILKQNRKTYPAALLLGV